MRTLVITAQGRVPGMDRAHTGGVEGEYKQRLTPSRCPRGGIRLDGRFCTDQRLENASAWGS